ncbi:COR domain-containing protein, partial [Moorena sp. SIO4E2]|uniref:COR domain-containing protein n=1 Tax=Moorena sp. SIO4E2 TaxID=2607826 RepID=UPI00257AC135
MGEAGAGKTSLAKKIQDPQYQLQYNQQSTEGIDVIKWSFPLDNVREFNVNIWDFGGQEIYHATHQFFLSKRSLYILVTDSRKEDTDFDYWLNIVEQFSDNSPLLIIKNEKQDRRRDINERTLRGKFTNLQATLATNLKTNRGLAEIIAAIQYYIQNLPHVGQPLPKTWVMVRQALENDSRNYISLDKFLDICETNGFTLLEDKLQLSGYLHDLGVCLHFQDQEESLLYKTVILKPEWGTDAVYKVLDNPNVKNNKGKFTRNDLKGIWQEDKYASTRGELLELMKKFQLCYEIPDCKDTFIAPQLLSDNQPDYDWNPSHNLILRYAYPDFMPKGIITRLIVVMHQYIDQQQYVWKSGVILTK